MLFESATPPWVPVKRTRSIPVGYSGINLGNVKTSNRSAILKLLNDRGPMSRRDISASLGLTPASVTLICSSLISEGILQEQGEMPEERRAGRPKVLVGINYAWRHVLTLSIEAAETCITVSDLRGNKLGDMCLDTDSTCSPEVFLSRVAREAKALMWGTGIGKDKMLGVGVSVPGRVDRERGMSLHAYRVWDKPVAVGETLERALGLPVIVENNVKAFATAELIYGIGREWENLLFVKWGPGVGSAIICANEIYDGLDSKAAEIGHCIVKKNGRLCRCGRRGCLETVASTHAVTNRIRDGLTEETMPELWHATGGNPDKITTHTIGECLATSDPGVWDVMNDVIDELARVTVNSITILAPDKVILYGYMFDFPHVRSHFLSACEGYDSSYDQKYLSVSDLWLKGGYVGPLAVAVNNMFLAGGWSSDGA